MKARNLLAGVVAVSVLGCARTPIVATGNLPLRRVVVYRNGVGYYERVGTVDEEQVSFRMRQKTVGDFLATLAIVERGGSTVRSASFPIEVEDPFEPQPQVCPSNPDRCPTPPPPPKEKNPLRNVILRLDGKEHDLAVGYVAETPVWRPSYRVVVGNQGQAELQFWGIVQNLSGEDWRNVELVLVAGAPLAFQSTLGTPITPERPIVTDTGEVIMGVPQGVTSLSNQPGGEVERYVPEEAAAREEAMPAESAPADEGMADALSNTGAPRPKAAAMRRGGADKKRTPSGGGTGYGYSMESADTDEPAPPLPPAPMAASVPQAPTLLGQAPSAPRNVSLLAGVAVEAGATRYALPYPITVPDESATMVLLASQKVPGESVFLFAPDAGVPDSTRHPFRVARFRNATSGLLERGPIAVFERGSFLGQGMLDSLPPGATATVPFALERAVALESSTRHDDRGARLYRVEAGVLFIERDTIVLTTYAMKNGISDSIKLLVRHPRVPGTRLFKPPPETEDNTGLGNALMPMTIKAHGRAELVVDERQPQRLQMDWLSPLADDAVKAYMADSRAEARAVQRLREAWTIRETWKKLVDENVRLATERAELERNAQQLRQSLKAIEKNTQAGDLRQKLTKKLDDSVSRLDQITKRTVEVELAVREQEVRFRDLILDLKILSAPPPRD